MTTIQPLINLMKNNRLGFLVISIGILVAFAFFLVTNNDSKATLTNFVPTPPSDYVAIDPTLYNGLNKNQTMRDPFAPPVYASSPYTNVTSPSTPSIAKSSSPKTSSPDKVPVLTGIMGGQDKTIAIIEYNGDSRYLQPGEKCGSYTLLKIEDTSAILSGPSGRLVLKMGGR